MEMTFSDSRHPVPGDSTYGLRPLNWGELCARLIAAHDTRGVLAVAGGSVATPGGAAPVSNGVAGRSSFHEFAAALLRSGEAVAEEPVNPAFSANGNDVEGTTGAVHDLAPRRRPDETRHD